MKIKKLSKIFIIITFIFLLLPFKNVEAADATYHYYWLKTANYIDESYIGKSYTINGGTIHIEKNFLLHEVNQGNSWYHGYCLHAGKVVLGNQPLKLYEGFTQLKNSSNKLLSKSQQILLKNIVASGYQNGNRKVNGSILDSSARHDVGRQQYSCKSKTVCEKIIATQLLVWEAMEGVRTNYNPDSLKESHKSYYNFVINNSGIYKQYKAILDDAKNLTTDGKIPAAFGKTYTLHWIDSLGKYSYSSWNKSSNKYTRDSLPIGSYRYKTDTKGKISLSMNGNNLYIDSSGAFTKADSYDLNFYLTKGSTLDVNNEFRWYKFTSGSGYQDILMGDHKVEFMQSLKVKTEKGKFYIAKYSNDSGTIKKLTGAEFEVYKCKKKGSCDKKSTGKIDLGSNYYGYLEINKSGLYRVVESKAPSGYNKISEVYVNLKITDGGKVEIISVDRGLNSNESIKITKGESTGRIYLSIYNTKKSLEIKKIDGVTGNAIKGATFQIKDSKGNILKFNRTKEGYYDYSASGKIDKIVDSNMSSYHISLLPVGSYTLIETAVPSPYVLPAKQTDRETYFKVTSTNSNPYSYSTLSSLTSKSCIGNTNNVAIKVKNYTTKVVVNKTGNEGAKLSGVKFKLYDKSKSKEIILSLNNTGSYNYVQNQTGTTIDLVTNENGQIIINNLPEGTYYLKEIEAALGYEIDESVQWTEIKVSINTKLSNISQIGKTEVQISNAKGTFNFYKIDEDGNYLNSGKFKLQVYNDNNGKYEDAAVNYDNEKNVYSIDKTGKSDIYTFTPTNGVVTFVNVDKAGKYRIVEIEAPEGFVLPSSNDAFVEFSVNGNGYINGDLTMINKKVTKGDGKQAQAELIINIQTGQQRIRYFVIIAVLLVIITALFILKNKFNKK